MTFQTGYEIGDTVKAKSPKRDKAEVFTIGQIKIETLSSDPTRHLIEYRSATKDGIFGTWYPEFWILGIVPKK